MFLMYYLQDIVVMYKFALGKLPGAYLLSGMAAESTRPTRVPEPFPAQEMAFAAKG
jgi:hypothetical protein